jgi:hypothetical protein
VAGRQVAVEDRRAAEVCVGVCLSICNSGFRNKAKTQVCVATAFVVEKTTVLLLPSSESERVRKERGCGDTAPAESSQSTRSRGRQERNKSKVIKRKPKGNREEQENLAAPAPLPMTPCPVELRCVQIFTTTSRPYGVVCCCDL